MTNPETREKVVLVTIIHALAFEIVTKMKMSRNANAFAALKRDYPDFKGNKKAGLRYAIDRIKELDPEYTIGRTVQTALAN